MAIRNVTRAGVGLVIGIVILALIVLASIWFVRERGEQARREEAIAIADQQLKAESDQEVAIDTDDASKDESEAATNGNGSTESSIGGSTAPSTSGSGSSASTATELPQTGPADALWVVGVGLVVFAGASYYQSRRVLFKVQ
ncbi:MAG: LPXTG cell wall anchor domain-containing protein [Candidatus Microsaccharimonas sp.]